MQTGGITTQPVMTITPLTESQIEKLDEELKEVEGSLRIDQIFHYQKANIYCEYCEDMFHFRYMKLHQSQCSKKNHQKQNSKVQKQMQVGLNNNILPDFDFRTSGILSSSEIERLTPLQYKAIEHMHKKSYQDSFGMWGPVYRRVRRSGFKQDMGKMMNYVATQIPLLVHIRPHWHMKYFVKDTHYRNQFQTGSSSGTTDRVKRSQWENKMYDNCYQDAQDFQRVKYGCVNLTNDPNGVCWALTYGKSFFLLKNHVKGRCTFSDGDSSDIKTYTGTLHFSLPVLHRLQDRELRKTMTSAKGQSHPSKLCATYSQFQIHGPLQFSRDIEKLFIHPNEIQGEQTLELIKQFSQKFNVPYSILEIEEKKKEQQNTVK